MEQIKRYLWDQDPVPHDTFHSLYLNANKFLILRFGYTIYMWTILIAQHIEQPIKFLSNFQYLTYWGVNFQCYLFSFIILQGAVALIRKNEKDLILMKYIHSVYEVLFSLQFTIVIIYWVSIYPTSNHEGESSFHVWINVSNHGVFYLIFLIDNLLSCVKPYQKHWVMLLLYLIAYFIVNISVSVSYSPVYSIITWESGLSYLFAFLAVVLSFVHFYLWTFYFSKVKDKKYKAFFKIGEKLQNQDAQPPNDVEKRQLNN